MLWIGGRYLLYAASNGGKISSIFFCGWSTRGSWSEFYCVGWWQGGVFVVVVAIVCIFLCDVVLYCINKNKNYP